MDRRIGLSQRHTLNPLPPPTATVTSTGIKSEQGVNQASLHTYLILWRFY